MTSRLKLALFLVFATLTLLEIPDALLTAQPSFTDGPRTMYIDNGLVRVGVDKDWGGAIREIWFNGQNLVNNYDGGRLIAVSFYDRDSPLAPIWGWNPTPSDKYNHANRPLTYSFENGILYVKVRYLQWNPDNKGGGQGRPVSSDVVVETWIGYLLQDPTAVSLRYKITHDGVDNHAVTGQELPFVYIRTPFPRFVRYTGNAPWTEDAVTIASAPAFPAFAETLATEYWSGFVNSNDEGLVLWTPQAYPSFQYVYFNNFDPENSTYYMHPTAYLEIGPEFSKEFEAYLFLGRWQDARRRIYNLNQTLVFTDVLPGWGNVDTPVRNATLSGIISVAGWAIDNRKVAQIEIFLDGVQIGQATLGSPRPDVARDYPGLPGTPNFGFSYSLDTRAHKNGNYVLEVRAVDTSGNTSLLVPGKMAVKIQN